MAIITCSECGKNVSDKAIKCIHCGVLITQRGNKTVVKKSEVKKDVIEKNATKKKVVLKKRKCSYCGGYSRADETHCLDCGARYEEPAMEEVVENKEPENSVKNEGEHSNNTFYSSNETMHVEQNAKVETYEFQTSMHSSPVKTKSKWTAFFLCLFLGVFGVHKFYEGKPKMGVLYLFTVGLFGIGWIYDCVSYLLKQSDYYDPNFKSEEEKKKKWIAIVVTIFIIFLIGSTNDSEENTNNQEKGDTSYTTTETQE